MKRASDHGAIRRLVFDVRDPSAPKAISDRAFTWLIDILGHRIYKTCSRYNVKGMETADLYQEALILIRYQLIPTFDAERLTSRGVRTEFVWFMFFALKRRLATKILHSQSLKQATMNRSTSISWKKLEDGSDIESILTDVKPLFLEELAEHDEFQDLWEELVSKLSASEKHCVEGYRAGHSYLEIANLWPKPPRTNVQKIKWCDNAISRARQKGIQILLERNPDERIQRGLVGRRNTPGNKFRRATRLVTGRRRKES